MALMLLDPGLRRDDGKGIVQRFLEGIVAGCAVLLASLSAIPATAAELPDKAGQALERFLPERSPDAVRKGPIEGLYEVAYGAQIFYVSADGRFLLQGAFLDTETGENVTEQRRGELIQAELERIGEDRMVIFAADEPKHTVTVFTDIDCGYCRKLHQEIDELNRRGISVRYLFFPRSGPDTASYYKAVSVWCAEDQQQALTDAKNDRPVPTRRCDNPVDEHMQLVHEFGLRGT
ncbi:MAG TPA: DsbC family protein, partial [Thiohalobacter sp.]|nr:DsbC family protein [Thiohalobacter sp.]